ncbi:hypothetical protein [Butyricimonas synergistica]|uniref:hypothetical protein n=1 Tax=Butyricimonas synergistica TaxID=544644 RepID=UPI000365A52C|nr:hypothetical protein [Butyricimonas synergistica]
MKMLRYILLNSWVLLFLVGCDTKQNVIYTGVSNPYFDGTIMDYLRSNKGNWELTVEMIERAGLVDLFEGNDESVPEMTFWAPPSYSILRFLLQSQKDAIPGATYRTVGDIPVDLCRSYILRCVVKGKFVKDSIGFRNEMYRISDDEQDGGMEFMALDGNRLRACREKSDWAGVPDVGPVALQLWSITRNALIEVASPDIQPTNGVVHALGYGFEFGKI